MMEHHTGELAYYDSFGGLIKVKVIKVNRYTITCKCTGRKNKTYSTGEIIQARSQHDVIPRKSVYIRNGQHRIRNNYIWR